MENYKEKKVAICMSAYNGELYIEQQIESLLNQSYRNIEIDRKSVV